MIGGRPGVCSGLWSVLAGAYTLSICNLDRQCGSFSVRSIGTVHAWACHALASRTLPEVWREVSPIVVSWDLRGS